MGVYELNDISYLDNDLNNIFTRLNQLYVVDFTDEQILLTPKVADTSEAFWASEENSSEFNTHIPTFKSLHKDMYAFIESVEVFRNGKYDYSKFEKKYPDYKEFRLLNNMIKHPKKKEVEISFTKIVHIVSKHFDLLCNFKYPI